MATAKKDDVSRLTASISQRGFKQWLKVRELEHSAANLEEFHNLLLKLLEKDELTLDELKSGVLEIEEYGAKRIFLRKLEGSKYLSSRKDFERHLRSLGKDLSESATKSLHFPSRPTLNYITWADSEIRIKFSETHEHVTYDDETLEPTVTERTKFALITCEPQTGFTKVCLDRPEVRNPHRKNATSSRSDPYEEYYFEKARDLLGAEELTSINLHGVIDGLVNANPRIFRLPHDEVITADGLRQRSSSESDVRDHRVYEVGAKADGNDRIYENLEGYWLPQHSEGRLRRQLFMQLKRQPSMVRFLADCLADEVNYAISRVRQLAQ